MKPIYDSEGQIQDFSDEGQWSEDLISEIDLHWLLKRLKPQQRKIILLRREGYVYQEIADKLNLSLSKVWREVKKIQIKSV